MIHETSTFAYREDGAPSEILTNLTSQPFAPDVRQEDFIDLSYRAGDHVIAVADRETPRSVAESVCENVEMKEMVDKIIGCDDNDSEHFNFNDESPLRAPPTPPSHSFESPSIRDQANDTSYGMLGTATAREFLRKLESTTPPKLSSQPGTPGPILPSIFNTPFALQPDEICSRPGTANGLPSPKFPLSHHRVHSSISSMQDPSSFSQPNTIQVDRYDGFSDPQPFGNKQSTSLTNLKLANGYGDTFSNGPSGNWESRLGSMGECKNTSLNSFLVNFPRGREPLKSFENGHGLKCLTSGYDFARGSCISSSHIA